MKRVLPSLKLTCVCTAILLIASLASIHSRNGAFEFCTTRAYGFPCPWFYQWCECENGSWPVNPLSVAANLFLCVAAGFLLARLLQLAQRLLPATRHPLSDEV
jgi:hypothetical protein